jgi:hypothetical protein
MKPIIFVLFLGLVPLTLAPPASAQSYLFSTLQCDPLSCVEEGPPETNGIVSVDFTSTCTGGLIAGINLDVTTQISNCNVPYIPYAQVQTSRTQYLDDCGDPFLVDYATFNAEVFTGGGVVVFHLETTYGCDDSQSGPTTFGTRPC